MVASTTLPWEDMLGIGGWMLYLFAAVLFLGAIALVGYRSFMFWLASLRLYAPRSFSVSLSLWLLFRGVAATLVLGVLIWVFVRMVVLQNVQVVRFEDDQVVLIYRWPWLNRSIPYSSITAVELTSDPPALTLPGARPRHGFPLKVVIRTRNRVFEIGSGPSRWRDKADAIRNELERHSSHLNE